MFAEVLKEQGTCPWNKTNAVPSARSSFGTENTVFCIIGSLGIFLNLAAAVMFHKGYRAVIPCGVTRVVLTNQSTLDFSCSLLLLVHSIVPACATTEMNAVLCMVWLSGYLYWALVANSSWNILFTSAERYFAVARPLKHLHFSKLGKVSVLLLTWTCGFIILCPILFHFQVDHGICVKSVVMTYDLDQSRNAREIFISAFFFFIPAISSLGFYCRLTFDIWQTKKDKRRLLRRMHGVMKKNQMGKLARTADQKQSDDNDKVARHLAKSFAAIAVLHFFCNSFVSVTHLIFIGSKTAFSDDWRLVGLVMAHSRLVLVPLSYLVLLNMVARTAAELLHQVSDATDNNNPEIVEEKVAVEEENHSTSYASDVDCRQDSVGASSTGSFFPTINTRHLSCRTSMLDVSTANNPHGHGESISKRGGTAGYPRMVRALDPENTQIVEILLSRFDHLESLVRELAVTMHQLNIKGGFEVGVHASDVSINIIDSNKEEHEYEDNDADIVEVEGKNTLSPNAAAEMDGGNSNFGYDENEP